MPEAAKELAILFVDICDSTELYERLGDAEARAMIDAWMSDSAQAVAAHGGRLVKSLGDGILSTFPSAESALAAALSMQEQKRTQVRIRAGFHLGPVIESGGDIFGDAVNVAARVAALAKEDEILFTESSVRALPPEARLGTRFLDKAMVKGKKEPVAIYGLVSDAVDNTVMMQAAESSSSGGSPLTLFYRDQTLALGEGSDRLQLGRDAANGLTVEGSHVSRSHATIEPRRGKFFLLDHSTNGTYVVFEGRAPVYLRRELLQLVGRGVISLGKLPSENQADTIRFVWGDSQDSHETPLPQKVLGRG